MAAAVLCVAAVVLYHSANDGGVDTLLSVKAIRERAQADTKSFGSAFRAARLDKLDDSAQEKMADKDAAVQKSLELAAAEMTVQAKQAETEFEEARKQQEALDKRLSKLAATMSSQQRQLGVALRELNGKEMLYSQASAMVPRLASGLQRVSADEQKLQQVKKAHAKALKPIEAEISDAKSVLKKSDDAFTEDRMRTQYDERQAKYSVARQNLQLARARVAAKQAAFFTQKAEETVKGQGPQRAHYLKEAQSEHDKTALLHAKAAEEAQKAQVWRAKAGEAASGMRMMQADVLAARSRLQQEEQAEAAARRHVGLGMFEHAAQEEEQRLSFAKQAQAQLRGEIPKLAAVVRRGEEELRGTEGALLKARGADMRDRREEGAGKRQMNRDLRRFTRDVEEAKDLQEAQELHRRAATKLGAAAKEAARVAADAVHGGVQEMQLGKYAEEEQQEAGQLRSLVRDRKSVV